MCNLFIIIMAFSLVLTLFCFPSSFSYFSHWPYFLHSYSIIPHFLTEPHVINPFFSLSFFNNNCFPLFLYYFLMIGFRYSFFASPIIQLYLFLFSFIYFSVHPFIRLILPFPWIYHSSILSVFHCSILILYFTQSFFVLRLFITPFAFLHCFFNFL